MTYCYVKKGAWYGVIRARTNCPTYKTSRYNEATLGTSRRKIRYFVKVQRVMKQNNLKTCKNVYWLELCIEYF